MEKNANEGKNLVVEVDGARYERIPVKTHVITDADKLADVLIKYVRPVLEDGDIVFMSEKAVACTQKRAIRMKDIKPRPLARFLCKFVYKTPYGIGLGIPETMEMALRECGTPLILFAAFISVIGKLLGKRGWFYRIAGEKARSIDGPCDCTLPPYNEYVVLGPLDPDKTAEDAAAQSGVPMFCIVDLNDLGGNILGASSPKIDRDWLLRVLKDNPLGQSDEQTPIGIIRKNTAGNTANETVLDKAPAVAESEAIEAPDTDPVHAWVKAQRDNMLDDLRRLVRIKSVADPESEVKPFGQGCRDAVDEVLKICTEYDVDAQNHDYYCASAFLSGIEESEIGLWSHLDVVPEGADWKYPPYEGILDSGHMVGRGVIDNKSAAVMGLYVLRYLRENGVPMRNGVRLFFGCNEENGMSDQKYYTDNFKLPDYSLIPDAEFPVCYGEKGIITANLVSPPLSDAVLDITGGMASNMVADTAVIRLKKTPELVEKAGLLGNVTILGDSVELRAEGKAAHAAMPEGSVSAIAVLAKLLVDNGLLCESDRKIFSFIRDVCADYTGGGLGIETGHAEYGDLTCIGGMVRKKDGNAVLNINIRYPYSENGGVVLSVIKSRCVEHGFTLTQATDSKPSLVPRDSVFVSSLLEAYREVTGDMTEPYIMGGGTYARNLPNAVAFGHVPDESKAEGLPGLPEGHGGIHQPDEALCIDDFLAATEIYIKAVILLDEAEG